MSRKKNNLKVGATPGKLAVVGVLAAILVFVIGQQLPESAPEAVSLQVKTTQQSPAANATTQQLIHTTATTPRQTTPRQTTLKQETNRKKEKLPTWPETKLAETLASNPFVPPLWAVNAIPLPNPTKLTALGKLQQQGATIVMISDGKKSATIGNNKYIVGDILAGYRVTDITTQGLHLEKL